MTQKTNADMPASALLLDSKRTPSGSFVADDYFDGLTKREVFCLHNGVADTGDEELDAIIQKGNWHKTAMHMMAHLMLHESLGSYEDAAMCATSAADALLAELERTK